MRERRAWFLIVLAVSSSGCVLNQGLAPADTFGQVTNTIDEEVPEDLQPAHIYEIDQQPVLYDKRTSLLAPVAISG
jgi:hypothetical protein